MNRKRFADMVRESLLIKIREERERQENKFGEQDCPDFDSVLLNRPGGVTAERLAEQYEIPTEDRGKFLCQNADAQGEVTYMHILVEEVAEVLGAFQDVSKLKGELIQVAAVCVKWIEAIERREAIAKGHEAFKDGAK